MFGSCLSTRESGTGTAVLVLTAAYVILVSSGPEAYSRFRMPVMPIFCVLAAGGYLCRLESRFGEREEGGEIALRDRPDAGLAAQRIL